MTYVILYLSTSISVVHVGACIPAQTRTRYGEQWTRTSTTAAWLSLVVPCSRRGVRSWRMASLSLHGRSRRRESSARLGRRGIDAVEVLSMAFNPSPSNSPSGVVGEVGKRTRAVCRVREFGAESSRRARRTSNCLGMTAGGAGETGLQCAEDPDK